MIHVTSEVGRLRRVLLHEPGLEVDRMVPAMMDDLLFDDVLFGDRAREEHALFRRVLQILGVDVVEATDLLVEHPGRARRPVRGSMRLIRDGLPPGLHGADGDGRERRTGRDAGGRGAAGCRAAGGRGGRAVRAAALPKLVLSARPADGPG